MKLSDMLENVKSFTPVVIALDGDEIYNGLRCDVPDSLIDGISTDGVIVDDLIMMITCHRE